MGLLEIPLELALFKVNKGLPKFIKGLPKVLIELSTFPELAHWFLPYWGSKFGGLDISTFPATVSLECWFCYKIPNICFIII